jgi:hypothetical protein
VRFFLDNNVDTAVRTVLFSAGHICWTAANAGLAAANDDSIAVYADEKDAVLVSHDKAFAERHKRTFTKLDGSVDGGFGGCGIAGVSADGRRGSATAGGDGRCHAAAGLGRLVALDAVIPIGAPAGRRRAARQAPAHIRVVALGYQASTGRSGRRVVWSV